MTNLSQMTPIERATFHQNLAAQPDKTVFVSANAGSGKTRVLVNRVSRLLLRNVRPEHILCLTYTQAAAAEMQARLFATLGHWSVLPDDDLSTQLSMLTGSSEPQTKEKLRLARQLFARALETPDGLRVQTIHAFCEKLLRRFPVEAGISPDFRPIDESEARKIGLEVRHRLLETGAADSDGKLAKAITHLAPNYSDQVIDAMFSWGIYNSWKAKAWDKVGVGALFDVLELSLTDTPESIVQEALAKTPISQIRAALPEITSSTSKTDQELAEAVIPIVENSTSIDAYLKYEAYFLTSSGSQKKRLSTKNVAPELFGSESKTSEYGSEPPRVWAAYQKRLAVEYAENIKAMQTIIVAAADEYSRIKKQRRLLDFSDQIERARALLELSEAREWVRYKLDQGVRHVLIDEAQDTSPSQWAIFDRITEEFEQKTEEVHTRFAVGDEKQSIYSFQGANPELFFKRTQDFISALPDKVIVPKLNMSFRSSQNVLALVDQVFAAEGAGAYLLGEPEASNIIEHPGARDITGRVELWPIAEKPDEDINEQAWQLPLDLPKPAHPIERVAEEIAKTLRARLDKGYQITDRESGKPRAMRASDVLILVQSRNPLFRALLRHLKNANLPVAGADRLVLTDSIAVQDLLSLAKFVLLPADDLSLAEVLKSPICGLNDDHLMTLAIGRKGTLWAAAQESDDPEIIAAVDVLKHALSLSQSENSYAFFSKFLTYCPKNGESIFKHFRSRLGGECVDPIEAFLSRALSFQRTEAPHLHGFVDSMLRDKSDIKRQPGVSDEIQVMTVHGAKGLEAPVVVLPDTTRLPRRGGPDRFDLIETDDGQFWHAGSSSTRPEHLQPILDEQSKSDYGEYLRLLYVALTRAENELIICGPRSGKKSKDIADGTDPFNDDPYKRTWYQLISHVMENRRGDIETPFGQGLFWGDAEKYGTRDAAIEIVRPVLPEWTLQNPPKESTVKRLTPSHLLMKPDAAPPFVYSPLMALEKRPDRFQRGIIIHKLLEILPDAPVEKRMPIAKDYVTQFEGFSPEEQNDILRSVFRVLDAPEFASLFAPGSSAEVSLIGRGADMPEGLELNAQIDRLAVTGEEVWIVDYKSNRPPPKHASDVPEIYLAQMAAYKSLAQKIWSDKTVHCGLLWTEVPVLMKLSDALLKKVDIHAAVTEAEA